MAVAAAARAGWPMLLRSSRRVASRRSHASLARVVPIAPVPQFVARVWDLFLAQGWAVVFRVALALLALEREVLPNLSFEAAMIHLRDIPARGLEVDKVVTHALLLNVPDAALLSVPL